MSLNTLQKPFVSGITSLFYKGKRVINYGDFHTHTIFSMHGMSSPSEMFEYANSIGLKYLAITDHHFPYKNGLEYNDPMYFHRKNQEARMWEYHRSFNNENMPAPRVLPGYEYNLYVPETDENFITYPHLRLIGLHTWHAYMSEITPADLIKEVNDRLGTCKYDIFTHPEREFLSIGTDYRGEERKKFFDDSEFNGRNHSGPKWMFDTLSEIIHICEETGTILEVNESSILSDRAKPNGNIGRMLHWIEEAKKKNMYVVVNSDAHIAYGIGNCNSAFSMLEEMDYPANRIINFDESAIKCLLCYPKSANEVN